MRFTGQQGDATGLLYMNARYYDPQLGQFISPDTLVPDATNLFDYNRYMYARGNPMKYNDPTGHCADGIVNPIHFLHSPCELGGPEAAAETELASAVEDAPAAAEASTPLVNAVNATDGAVVYDAPAVEEIGSSQTSDTVTLENSIESEPCSFSRETTVTTQKGQKPIGVVKTGDLVLAYNEILGKTGFYTVTATMAHVDPVVVTLTLDGEQIHTTPEHPFYTASGSWVTAGDLHPGDTIRKANGNHGFVQAIEVVQRQQVMYDLTVAQAHTFFVGEQEWLVHNDCGGTGGIRGAAPGLGDSGGPTAGKDITSAQRKIDLANNKSMNPNEHYRCENCGFESSNPSDFDIDHIVPKSQGGNTTLQNRRVLCVGCNRSAQEGWPPNPGSDWATKYPDRDMRPK